MCRRRAGSNLRRCGFIMRLSLVGTTDREGGGDFVANNAFPVFGNGRVASQCREPTNPPQQLALRPCLATIEVHLKMQAIDCMATIRALLRRENCFDIHGGVQVLRLAYLHWCKIVHYRRLWSLTHLFKSASKKKVKKNQSKIVNWSIWCVVNLFPVTHQGHTQQTGPV